MAKKRESKSTKKQNIVRRSFNTVGRNITGRQDIDKDPNKYLTDAEVKPLKDFFSNREKAKKKKKSKAAEELMD